MCHDTLAVAQLLNNFGLNGGFQGGNTFSPPKNEETDYNRLTDWRARQVQPFFESCGLVLPISLVKSSDRVFAERKCWPPLPFYTSLLNSRFKATSCLCCSSFFRNLALSQLERKLFGYEVPCKSSARTGAWHDAVQGWRPFRRFWPFESIIPTVWQKCKKHSFSGAGCADSSFWTERGRPANVFQSPFYNEDRQ